MPSPTPTDARNALLSSFAGLVLSRRYSDIRVDQIIHAARVARSTFYYHFSGKDDLLLENLSPLIEALADAPFGAKPDHELDLWVAHIWQHRARAARLLSGRTRTKLHAKLVGAVHSRLVDHGTRASDATPAMLAEQMAGGSLALLTAWVTHQFSATPEMIVRSLQQGGRAMVDYRLNNVI